MRRPAIRGPGPRAGRRPPPGRRRRSGRADGPRRKTGESGRSARGAGPPRSAPRATPSREPQGGDRWIPRSTFDSRKPPVARGRGGRGSGEGDLAGRARDARSVATARGTRYTAMGQPPKRCYCSAFGGEAGISSPFSRSRSAAARHRAEGEPRSLGDVEQGGSAVGLVEHPEHRHLQLARIRVAAHRAVEAPAAELRLALRARVDGSGRSPRGPRARPGRPAANRRAARGERRRGRRPRCGTRDSGRAACA